MHVAARSLATHALSIFGDHSDVMAARTTGVAMLASGSPQEAQDLAAIAHAATLRCRVPFLHFFDGFRTSHEIQKLAVLDDDVLRVAARRRRRWPRTGPGRCRPDRPGGPGHRRRTPTRSSSAVRRPTRSTTPAPASWPTTWTQFAELTGRRYGLFDYVGHPEAERVVVMMGSGAECAHETVDTWWRRASGSGC